MTIKTRLKSIERIRNQKEVASTGGLTEDERIWLSGQLFFNGFFAVTPEVEQDPEYQEFIQASAVWKRYWHKRDIPMPPVPVWLRKYHDERETEHQAWAAELGHEPTSLDLLAKYQHLWNQDQTS